MDGTQNRGKRYGYGNNVFILALPVSPTEVAPPLDLTVVLNFSCRFGKPGHRAAGLRVAKELWILWNKMAGDKAP
jgi:hypothetical protein